MITEEEVEDMWIDAIKDYLSEEEEKFAANTKSSGPELEACWPRTYNTIQSRFNIWPALPTVADPHEPEFRLDAADERDPSHSDQGSLTSIGVARG